jgi:2-dehydropantoate 2-reductase
MGTKPILIAGAGAIGSVTGAMLSASGRQVALLGRKPHMDAIAREGLQLSGFFGERVVRDFTLASVAGELRGPFDLILLTVKSYDTESAARDLDRLLSRQGVVVSMQNGIGNVELLVERLGAARVLGARVIFGAEIVSPGAVRATVFAEPVAIGPAPAVQGAHSARLKERASEVAATLSAAGIAAHPCGDIAPYLWAKLFYNAALNPLGALLRLDYGALAADPDLRAIMDGVIDEAFAVAERMGVAPGFKSAADYRAHFYSKLIPPTVTHRPTMLYDLERRGRTEIGAINGKVADLAERLGVRADANRMLTRLIRARERLHSQSLKEEG